MDDGRMLFGKPRPSVGASDFSLSVNKLVEAGQKVDVGEVWTFLDMAEVIGKKCEGGSSWVQTALLRLAKQHGIEFANVRSVGYQRLSDEAIVEQLPADRKKIASVVKRTELRAANVRDYGGLPNHLKHQHDAHTTVARFIGQFMRPKVVRRLEAELSGSTEVDIDRVLGLFKRPRQIEQQ